MSKREISSTLKNLKFMQRASQKEEKPITNNSKEAEVTSAGDFASASTVRKRCVVIYEGDSQPGPTRGRMSFLGFYPVIDKLNAEESEPSENESVAGRQKETAARESDPATDDMDDLDVNSLSNGAHGDLKRKQVDVELDPSFSSKSKKGNKNSSSSNSRSSQKQNKREKLDWNVLRPPKYPNKTR